MKKQRAVLEEQYKANFSSMLESNKSSLQETIDAKDSIIQALKSQSTNMQQQLDKCMKMLNELQINNINNVAEEKAKLQSVLEAKHQEEIKELKFQKTVMEERDKAYLASILESKNFTIQEMANKSGDLQKQLDKCTTQLEQYLNQLDELRRSNATIISDEKAKLQSVLESRHKEELKELKSQSNSVQKQLDDYKKQLHELQLSHTNSIAEEKAKLQAALDSKHRIEIKELNEQRAKELSVMQNNTLEQLQNTLLEKLDPITKFYGGTNTEKGEGGEGAIRDVLTTCGTYDASTVTDVSGQTATGDIIFNWGKMKCLIEVKNKKKLTKEDIDKFIRDVNQSADKINCAIFISGQITRNNATRLHKRNSYYIHIHASTV
jgi:chromosome segregation ATPase